MKLATARHAPPASDFDAFFHREYARLVAMVVAVTGDRETARDVAQEALLRAFRDWHHVSSLDRPGAWVRRVAVNLVTDRGRRLRNETRTLELMRPVDQVQPAGMSPDFWAAVRSLPERQRVAVALYYIVDRSVAEIAAVMGVNPGTVKTTLFHARQTLARQLAIEEEQ